MKENRNRLIRHVFIFAEVISFAALAQTQGQWQIRRVADYPVLQAGQTTYIIPASDSELYIDTLHLPANVILKADASIHAISWTVRKIVINQGNSTFDLSAPRVPAASGRKGAKPKPPKPWQLDFCENGTKGNKGERGTDGAASIPLKIIGVRVIENHGSLWIRSDGQPGGNGGTGGQGQDGSFCSVLFDFRWPTDGGPGGDGGDPGSGGTVSEVSITTDTAPDTNILQQIVDTAHCWPSYDQQRPVSANFSSSVIIASGVPGCPGNKGQNGLNGRKQPICCSWLTD